jgi:hypothetical protein
LQFILQLLISSNTGECRKIAKQSSTSAPSRTIFCSISHLLTRLMADSTSLASENGDKITLINVINYCHKRMEYLGGNWRPRSASTAQDGVWYKCRSSYQRSYQLLPPPIRRLLLSRGIGSEIRRIRTPETHSPDDGSLQCVLVVVARWS